MGRHEHTLDTHLRMISETQSDVMNVDVALKDLSERLKSNSNLLGKRCSRLEDETKAMNRQLDNPKDLTSELKMQILELDHRLQKELLDIRTLSEDLKLKLTTDYSEIKEREI
jgi:chromosome segregation ATPase